MEFKSPRASLQLTQWLGGYIQWVRSRAPTGKIRNRIKTKLSRVIMSVNL
jgi:hypothetical protein